MAKARPVIGVDGSTPMREVATRTIAVRTDEVFSFADKVLDTGDIERVHDMRVATRRLRAALEVFAACFPPAEYREALRDVKALADALGARRDPDVALASVHRFASGLASADRGGLADFEDDLRHEQTSGNALLEQALHDAVESQLKSRLLE